MRIPLLCLLLIAVSAMPADAAQAPITVTFDTPGSVVGGHPLGFGPGANGIIESITGDTVILRSDRRGANNTQDDHDNWFWFYARIHSGGRPTLKLKVNSVARGFTSRGPAVSFDNGITWDWNRSDTITFPPGAQNVLVALAPPYTDHHWQEFLARLGTRAPRIRTLTTSQRGRAVPLAEFGPANGATHRILVFARSHAMEVTSSVVLEGFLETIATDPLWANRLGHTLIQAVPFVDRDGVELGEQGKGRRPHDHNGDYDQQRRIYPETRAIIALNEDAKLPAVTVSVDLHSPWIHGGQNHTIFAYMPTDAALFPRLNTFVQRLATINQAATWPTNTYRTASNQDSVPDAVRNNRGYFSLGPRPAEIAITFEMPFAQNHNEDVTWERLRGFGRSLALAVAEEIPASIQP